MHGHLNVKCGNDVQDSTYHLLHLLSEIHKFSSWAQCCVVDHVVTLVTARLQRTKGRCVVCHESHV
jgi:ethanolamine ammonia-lyase large subunit